MCLIEIMERFPSQESCYEFLESIRYKDGAFCPYCASTNVAKKKEKDKMGRWNCHDCYSSFRVTQGTLFQGTKIPLQKWFLAIVLIANAKKSLSSCQLARDLAMNQKSSGNGDQEQCYLERDYRSGRNLRRRQASEGEQAK